MKRYFALKSGLVLTLALLLRTSAYTQIVFSDWVVGAGTKGWDIVNAIACDTSGNIYITGSNTDTVSKSRTVKIATHTRKCMFVAKYDTSGKLLWKKNILKSGFGYGSLISVVNPAQIILAGGVGIENKDNISGTEKFSFFVSSLNQAGKTIWTQTFTGTRNDFLTSMIVDTLSNEILICGYFHDTLSINGKILITKGNSDGFLLRFDMKGGMKSAQAMGGNGADNLQCIAVNDKGDRYAVGTYQRKIQLSKKISLELSSPRQVGLYIEKFNHVGDLVKAQQLVVGKKLRVNAMVCKGTLCFLAGSFSDDITVNNKIVHSQGSDDVFIICIDSSLQVKWYKQIGGDRKDRTAGMINTGEEIILTGSFCKEMKADQKTLTSSGKGSDLFLLSIDTAGTLKWIRNAGGDADDYPKCMVYGPGNYIYVAGSFRESFKLNGKTIQSNGEEDLFICRLENCRTLAPVFNQPEYRCDELSLKLDAGEGFISYDWANGLSRERIFNVDLGGNYPLELIAANGCMIYDTISVIDVLRPDVNLGNDTTIADTSRILLTAGNNYAHYLWNNGSIEPEILIKGVELHEGPNLEKVTVTNDKGCIGDDDILITMIRTMSDQISELVASSCVLFPNPSSGLVTVYFSISYKSLVLTINDPMGKEIITRSFSGYEKNSPMEFTLGSMPKGLYTLYIKTESGQATKKIILQ